MKKYFFLLSLLAPLFMKAQDNISGKRIDFVPDTFYHRFSAAIIPVLKIHSGDTVHTETIDAMGIDKNGNRRTFGGNPLTGPFYIEDAAPGDIIAVKLIKVSLNRSYAKTTEYLISKSVPKQFQKLSVKPRLVNWKLDTATGFAFPDTSYENLRNFKLPLNPFLGCLGVAPEEPKGLLSFFQGPFGGNLDCSFITQNATIYLPVFHPGALLFMGDGHALQGDGEINGNALETSMDILFSVRLIKSNGAALKTPRIEDQQAIMSFGIDKSLDKALQMATEDMVEWLQKDYRLSLSEVSQVIGSSVEYKIAEIADPKVEVVARIKKETLKALKK